MSAYLGTTRHTNELRMSFYRQSDLRKVLYRAEMLQCSTAMFGYIGEITEKRHKWCREIIRHFILTYNYDC